MEYTREIVLQFIPSGDIPVVIVKQGDTSTRFIKVTVIKEDSIYHPGAEQTILFREEKPDGTGVLADNKSIDTELERYLVTVDADGFITIELTEQMTVCPGYCKCDLCFVSDGEIISTAPFILEVVEVPDVTGLAISSNDFRSLINALEKVWDAGVVDIPGATESGTIAIGTEWQGDDPYYIQVTTSYTLTDQTMVNAMTDSTVVEQMFADGVNEIYFVNTGGSLTAYAIGGKPSVPLTVPVVYVETGGATYDNVQDGQVIAYDGTAGRWINKDLSDYGLLDENGVRTLITSYGYQTADQVNQLIRNYITTLDANSVRY